LQTFAADYPTLAAWLVTIGSALVATLVALVAFRLALTAVARLAQRRVYATTVLQHAKASARVVVVLLALQLVWNAAPDDLPRLATIERFTAVALTVAIAWLGMRCVGGLAEAIILNNPVTMANNLDARRVQTQTRVFARTIMGLILFIGVAVALMSFPAIRSIGTSLLASAGVAGLVIGLAARPALGNLIAGLQIALTQPIRLDDVVIIEGEWGRIEEIGAAHVVVRIWDQRRLVVPLQWFIDHPFQNWTLTSSEIIGTVYLWTDYRLPVAPVAAELRRLCDESEAFDRRVCVLQVTDASERAMQLRALVSSTDSGRNWDLRCHVRAGLIAFIQQHYPECLPQTRVDIGGADRDRDATDSAPTHLADASAATHAPSPVTPATTQATMSTRASPPPTTPSPTTPIRGT
jgi:small-conductance mechanosensitive channel